MSIPARRAATCRPWRGHVLDMGNEEYPGLTSIRVPGNMYGEEGMPGQRQAETKTPLAASYVSLTGGIVRALGANGRRKPAQSRAASGGRVPTGNERAAVGAYCEAYDYPNAENDALLRKALTAPKASGQAVKN